MTNCSLFCRMTGSTRPSTTCSSRGRCCYRRPSTSSRPGRRYRRHRSRSGHQESAEKLEDILQRFVFRFSYIFLNNLPRIYKQRDGRKASFIQFWPFYLQNSIKPNNCYMLINIYEKCLQINENYQQKGENCLQIF